MPPKKQQVYVLVDAATFDAESVIGVYGSRESADAALAANDADLEVQKMEVKEFVGAESKTSKTKACATCI